MSEAVFEAGNVVLQSGITLRGTKLVYKTYGTLAPDKSNVVVYPTSYSAQHTDIEWLIGPDRILDPAKYWIVVPNMLTNGLSTSPSNVAAPFDRGRFPLVTAHDNVKLQHRLLTEVFGIDRIALVYGWSMGGQQAYHWASMYPDMVARACVVCGSARTSPHNFVFLEGVKSALMADPAWQNGWFVRQPLAGLRAMGRIYAGWALSQSFYRQELWRQLGAASLEDFLVSGWEGNFQRRDANDLLAQLLTWQAGDIAANERFKGDLDAALRSIKAKTLVMPGATDLYFQVDDNALEVPKLANGRLLPIPSIWGHRAGNPSANKEDERFIAKAVRELLAA
ncbi:MAG: alpha/beta fold hydrolase [Alphaproteobacteria bacterium]|nr:alpha/beta fold hydrolase [Alphaproteobacteria bacterium]